MTDDRSEEERLADEEKRAREEINRAQQADRLLEGQLFKEAVEAIKDQFWKEFVGSDPTGEGDDLRRNARVGMEILDRILTSLRHHVKTGKLASTQMALIEQRKKSLYQRLKRRVA